MKNYKYKLDKLPSGLQVLRVPVESDSVLCMCLANTGSRYESENEFGIAHFFEHMVFKGTQKYPTAKEIAMKIDGIGANFNAFTAEEYTGYYIHGAAKHFDLSLDMVSEMVMRPLLDENEIDRERGVIFEEMNMYIDSPRSHINNMFDQMMMAGSGLGHDIIGNRESVGNIKRESFVNFLQKWYGLDNLLIVLAGKKATLNDDKILDQVNEAFADGNFSRNKAPDLKSYLNNDFIYGDKLHVESRKTEQAHFILGWPGLKMGDDREHVETLLRVILGGNMSSRLFSEVREKRGLCYSIGAFAHSYRDAGQFGAMAGVALDKIQEALKVSVAQFAELASGENKISAGELIRAKDYVEGKMTLGMEDGVAVGESFGFQQLLEGKIDSPRDELKKIKAVSAEEIINLANEIVKENQLRLALIGPYDDKSAFEQLLSTF